MVTDSRDSAATFFKEGLLVKKTYKILFSLGVVLTDWVNPYSKINSIIVSHKLEG